MNLLRVPGVEHASRLKIPELSGETKAHANFSVFPQAQLGSVRGKHNAHHHGNPQRVLSLVARTVLI